MNFLPSSISTIACSLVKQVVVLCVTIMVQMITWDQIRSFFFFFFFLVFQSIEGKHILYFAYIVISKFISFVFSTSIAVVIFPFSHWFSHNEIRCKVKWPQFDAIYLHRSNVSSLIMRIRLNCWCCQHSNLFHSREFCCMWHRMNAYRHFVMRKWMRMNVLNFYVHYSTVIINIYSILFTFCRTHWEKNAQSK